MRHTRHTKWVQEAVLTVIHTNLQHHLEVLYSRQQEELAQMFCTSTATAARSSDWALECSTAQHLMVVPVL